jgi:hypothetical protein
MIQATFIQDPTVFDLDRIDREIEVRGRALGFAGSEVKATIMHRTFDDRPRDEAVREFNLLVRAKASVAK